MDIHPMVNDPSNHHSYAPNPAILPHWPGRRHKYHRDAPLEPWQGTEAAVATPSTLRGKGSPAEAEPSAQSVAGSGPRWTADSSHHPIDFRDGTVPRNLGSAGEQTPQHQLKMAFHPGQSCYHIGLSWLLVLDFSHSGMGWGFMTDSRESFDANYFLGYDRRSWSRRLYTGDMYFPWLRSLCEISILRNSPATMKYSLM